MEQFSFIEIDTFRTISYFSHKRRGMKYQEKYEKTMLLSKKIAWKLFHFLHNFFAILKGKKEISQNIGFFSYFPPKTYMDIKTCPNFPKK